MDVNLLKRIIPNGLKHSGRLVRVVAVSSDVSHLKTNSADARGQIAAISRNGSTTPVLTEPAVPTTIIA